MISSLVGYTGFVGSNLTNNYNFSNVYNSKNIETAFGTKPDLLIYSGVKAEKFLANQYPDKDYETVKNAFDNIRKIDAKQVVLISTIDVYKNPVNVNEDTDINIDNLHPYGLNRYYLEQWVENEYENSLIVRLPGLFGKNIKKNFIYDMIYIIPNLLKESKFEELRDIDSRIDEFYFHLDNGFYKCRDLSSDERIVLKDYFNRLGFSALNFTDSRGSFQFYNLDHLWEHINISLNNGIRKLNLATEPVTINEIYQSIRGYEFFNEFANLIPCYNYKTKYADLYQGSNGYIFSKEEVLKDIKKFVEEYKV